MYDTVIKYFIRFFFLGRTCSELQIHKLYIRIQSYYKQNTKLVELALNRVTINSDFLSIICAIPFETKKLDLIQQQQQQIKIRTIHFSKIGSRKCKANKKNRMDSTDK